MGRANPYTIRKLTDLEDLAVGYGHSELLEARFANAELGTQQTGLSHQRLKPNVRQPFGHKHGQAEEVYVVLSGSGRAKLDDDVVEVSELDAIRVAPGVLRAFEAGDGGLELIVFGPRHDGDAELVPGWWVDEGTRFPQPLLAARGQQNTSIRIPSGSNAKKA